MASIKINQAFSMPYDELKEGLDQLAVKLGEQYQLDCKWASDDCLRFQRTGADGASGTLPQHHAIEKEIRSFIDEYIY